MAELKQASEQHDGPIAAKTDNAHDSFADYRMGQIPEFKAPALGQGSKFVEWQMDLGKCDSLLHSMWLVGDGSTSSDKSNDNLYVGPTALSRMSQSELNKCAESLTPSYYATKDAAGNVEHIGYRRDTPDFVNPLEHPFISIVADPAIAIIKAYQAVHNLFGDDSSVTVKGGQAIYSAPKYYIQDRSSTVRVKLSD